MESEKKIEVEKKNGSVDGIADKLIEKAEDFMDEAAAKISRSETYRKLGDTMEKTTLNIFRKAGKFWGKL